MVVGLRSLTYPVKLKYLEDFGSSLEGRNVF
jgi:hypothetical protein